LECQRGAVEEEQKVAHQRGFAGLAFQPEATARIHQKAMDRWVRTPHRMDNHFWGQWHCANKFTAFLREPAQIMGQEWGMHPDCYLQNGNRMARRQTTAKDTNALLLIE
jgi:hypothetical protein